VRARDGEGVGRVSGLDLSEQLRLYAEMCRIRAFEETAEMLVREARVAGNLHLSIGQEAVAVGVCSALRPDDRMTTTHRGHGHCLAKGGDPERMFAELFGHADGYSRGRAGSMHIADPRSGILGATAIVGGGFGLAVGAAFAAQTLESDAVTVAFFGEGAAAEGSFHEALNLAALWRLPLVFCCENNQYAELTHVSLHLSGGIADVARAHGMAVSELDGNDVFAVRAAADAAIARGRAGEGPTLLEAHTYRLSGHYVGDPEAYRDRQEVAAWRDRDPLVRARGRLLAEVEEARLDELATEATIAMRGAAERAEAGSPSPVESILQDVYAA
jgi:TPP-dependent pyruvate/acetoin dehydrogenase alpha subunit